MSLLFIDGFDHYTTNGIVAKWIIVDSGGTPSIITDGGRRGGGAARTYYGALRKRFTEVSGVVVGAALRQTTSNATIMFSFKYLGTTQAYVSYVPSTGLMSLYAGGNLLWSDNTGLWAYSAWAYFEMKVVAHQSAGSVELRMNGVTLASFSGIDTSVTTVEKIDSVDFANQSGYCYIDDVYILDTTGTVNNDFLGDCRVDALLPNSDGASQEWVPSTGTAHYAVVDEPLYSDTDYLETDAANRTETLGYSNVPVLGDILGVQVVSRIAKVDAGFARAKNVVRVNSTDYLSAEYVISDTVRAYTHILDKNPDTNAAWSAAEVDAAEFGVSRTV